MITEVLTRRSYQKTYSGNIRLNYTILSLNVEDFDGEKIVSTIFGMQNLTSLSLVHVEVTTSGKTLRLYSCISVTWKLLLRRNKSILNKDQCILLYP